MKHYTIYFLICYLLICSHIVNAETIIPHIMAYDLSVTKEENNYIFTFFANTQPTYGAIIFYSMDGGVIGEYSIIEPLQKGDNNITLSADQLPQTREPILWAIQLTADNNYEFGVVYEGTIYNRLYATIDNNPQSNYFGHIYLANRRAAGACNIYAINYKYETTLITGNDYCIFSSIGRPSIDSEGYIYWPDWGDLKSGITIMNPVNYSAKQFFSGIQNDDNGAWYNAFTQTDLGSSSSGVSIYGFGKDTKLYAMNEDKGEYNQLTKKGFVTYQLGNEDGTISRQWKTAPTQVVTVEDNNSNGNFAIAACSHGAWLCQHTLTNQAGTYALMFYDHLGTRQFASTDATLINGSNGAGIAINREENLLAMVNADGEILLFDIIWNNDKPTLTLNTIYKTGYKAIGSMHFDYAGNLVTTSGNHFGGNTDDLRLVIYSTPTENNFILIPARLSQQIQHHGIGTSETGISHLDSNIPKKVLKNGHLYILQNEKIYSILGF